MKNILRVSLLVVLFVAIIVGVYFFSQSTAESPDLYCGERPPCGGWAPMLPEDFLFGDDEPAGPNPFRLYQRVYPTEEFYNLGAETEEVMFIAHNGATIIDQTNSLIRVLFDDGTVSVYHISFFVERGDDEDRNASEYSYWYSDSWRIGNQFKVGDVVCVSPGYASDIPSVTVILKLDGDLVHVLGHSGALEFTHYQNCK